MQEDIKKKNDQVRDLNQVTDQLRRDIDAHTVSEATLRNENT